MKSDILCGLDAISDYLGLSKANVRKEIRAGRLTVSLHYGKYRTTVEECKRWSMTKSKIKEFHEQETET